MEIKMNGQMDVVSNCPLCEERGLHVVGEGKLQTQQCISCGYATNFNFKFDEDKEDNKYYKTLTDQMKSWVKIANNQVWIPSFITLPVGMIFPTDIDGIMKWGYAEMVDIPEEDRVNYPVEGQTDKFYERKYDTDKAENHDEFVVVLSKLNEKIKSGQSNATEG